MSGPDPRPTLFRSFDQAVRLVQGVSPEQLSLPTPCAEFDVSALLTHLVGVGNRIVSIGRGEPQKDTLTTPEEVGDDGWGDVFESTREQASSVWAGDDVLERKTELPFGTFSGATAAQIYTLELTVHGWDLASATGQVGALDDELAEVSLVTAQGLLPPEPRGGFIPFDAVVAVPEDASAYDRLAGYMGRGTA